jgi:hypothetical protein
MERIPRTGEGLVADVAVRRWEVAGDWILGVKIVVHQARIVGVLGRRARM